MKRILSIFLALSLLVSFSMIAQAATVDYLVTGIDTVPRKENDSGYIEDSEASTATGDEDRINFGDMVYYALVSSYHPNECVTESSAVTSVTIKKTWDSGSAIVESVSIVRRKDASSGIYRYYLGLQLRESTSKTDVDVIGTITLRKTGTNAFDTEDNEIQLDVSLTVGKPHLDAYDGMTLTDNDVIYTFDNDSGEVQINLSESTGGYYKVDATDQVLVLSCNYEYDEDIADRYPDANLDFVNLSDVHFGKTGTLVLYANDDSYIYSIGDSGSLSRIFVGYDESVGGYSMDTRSWGRYAISDKILNVASTSSSSTESSSTSSYTSSTGNEPTSSAAPTGGTGTSTTVKVNPATGAAA